MHRRQYLPGHIKVSRKVVAEHNRQLRAELAIVNAERDSIAKRYEITRAARELLDSRTLRARWNRLVANLKRFLTRPVLA